MLEFISYLGHVFRMIIEFVFNIRVEDEMTVGKIVYIIIALGLFFAFIHGRGSNGGSNDTYQPKHSYAPKHARKE